MQNLPYLLGPPTRICWVKGEWQEALEGVMWSTVLAAAQE